ncbi:protein-L-isoaspartate O-methyltransferase [Novosphingobium sp. ST904]|uniref:protein-L-isoaspartate O-methyltransferase family protein n=1 Tax=Novosphingobium sp. ST904 TaxID=1684385 RepID=UPI0006C8456C|nr:protein-L-isoaspartate O-methyltransferase [Novosphingobium sp. ST904]KPH57461.1 protein-L-isoaspartate O-methyltransferase [Novosphingobium sp. ST904]TCM43006.1 protein-L-isoaspartate(D-aspartate) O-methyltransferase [Novosphingobium sp. ST904]
MTLTEDRSATEARHAMIVSQLRTSGVNEHWVLNAMAGIAREDFVPATMRDAAYIDRAIPLGNGRFLAAPLVHGKMLAEAAPTKEDKVLLVGEVNGYLAALLRPLVGSLEVVDPAEVAGLAGEGGYSLVVIDGAVEELPAAVVAQVAEGGRVVTGIIVRGVARLATGLKTAGAVSLLPLIEMGIPALPEFAAPKPWSF